ncbi:MAG: 5-(carboxyamino)imidazole ribonucleotide synthase [Elusimicrobia bacterium]|nr:5-(carboxyamino)imidazole ribonucleotide synthase [Elusimicrobiota bacterium]
MKTILPGATIGILGGGQLGRMLALAAKRMGYKVLTLDPAPDSPCGQVADDQVVAQYNDIKAALEFAERCDAVTYEFENISVQCVEAIEHTKKIMRPGSDVLRVTQDRLSEKQFVRRLGIGTTEFERVVTGTDLEAAMKSLGFPAVLKTARGGYDGKGQAVVRDRAQAMDAFHKFDAKTMIWERFVPFARELSIVCARGADGKTAVYPVTENSHEQNILDTTIAPAKVSPKTAKDAAKIAEKIAKGLGIVGTFCVELFELKGGKLLVNEIAPRPHNSGHYTIDACACSQFENQLRAVCGLPLGSPEMRSPAAMVNVLGEGKGDQLTGAEKALSDENVHLHIYGKPEASARRKMGHVTALGANPEAALAAAKSARKKLAWTKK